MQNRDSTSQKSSNDDRGQHNLVNLAVVVNGKKEVIQINLNAPLLNLVEKALERTGNMGRPVTDWRLKWGNQELDLSKKVKEYDFPDNVELFLSLHAGKGG